MTITTFGTVKRDPTAVIRGLDYPAYLMAEDPKAEPIPPGLTAKAVEAVLKAAPRTPLRYDNGAVNAPRIAHVVNRVAARARDEGGEPWPTDQEIILLDPHQQGKETK